MAKLLSLDVGSKRIGIAVGDPTLAMAFPRGFLLNNPAGIFNEIKKLCVDEGVTTLIVGEPLGEENEPTKRSQEVRGFAEKLHANIPEIPLYFIDESMTTKLAQSRIPLKKHRKEKGRDDAIAAQIILEKAFESMAQSGTYGEALKN